MRALSLLRGGFDHVTDVHDDDDDDDGDDDDGDAYNVGRFAAPARFHFTPLPVDVAVRASVLDAAPPGSAFRLFGYRIVLGPRHVRPRALERWRAAGDPVGDAALRALDVLRRNPHSAVARCVAGAWRGGTGGAGGCGDGPLTLAAAVDAHAGDAAAVAALRDAVRVVPPWLEWPRVRRAARFYRRNAPALGLALLHLSLVGGFGAPRIAATLVAAGGLAGARDATYTRLLETLQLVDDCFGAAPGAAALDDDGGAAALRPGGRGWASAVAVRLLHASVRVRLLQRRRTAGGDGGGGAAACPSFASGAGAAACPPSRAVAAGDGDDDGDSDVPINQEDLVTTQLAFGLVPLVGLERLGAASHVSVAEMEDWLHAWRWVGHLLGVDAATGAGTDTLAGAQALLESTAAHLMAPDAGSAALALGVLAATAHRPMLRWSLTQGVAATRAFAGDELADALGLPAPGGAALRAADAGLRAAVDAAAGGRAGARVADRPPSWWAAAVRGGARVLAAVAATAFAGGAALCAVAPCCRRRRRTRRRADADAGVERVIAALALAPVIASLPCGVGETFVRASGAAMRETVLRGLGGRTAFLPRSWRSSEQSAAGCSDGS